MSQFYANIQGNRGETTRMGTKSSGIEGHIRGWNVGIKIYGYFKDGEDHFDVYLTTGSGGSVTNQRVGTFTAKDVSGS